MTDQGECRPVVQTSTKGTAGRGIRRALIGGGIAVAATAVMIGITLPRSASGDDHSGTDGVNAAASGTPGTPTTAATENAAPQGEEKTGRGPLTKAEVDRAKSIALQRNALRSAESVDGGRGPEYVDTDLADSAQPQGDDARRVEVLFYDYGHDQLVKKTVNLTTGEVEQTDTASGMQPPPSADETDQAAQLLIADPLGKGLRTDFKAAGKGTELTKSSQLTLRGIAYNTAEQSGPADLAKCGKHRCVRLFTQVKGGPWIDTTNLVVDLSDRTVGQIAPAQHSH
ncbi:Tat pathway signal sequence domain protein [Actinacidiphila soli]|uniref:Tat pathway signal sequence domain protein n=1 Tax=Actinacidiphila soli TaxID=2487275 RepID=UPI001F0C3D61|nr:Tat pathway signal sequence domain protein [Actinacidiphila soli]